MKRATGGRYRRGRRLQAAAIAAVLALLPACGGGSGSESTDGGEGGGLGTIKVAYVSAGTLSPPIAQDLGIFEEFGLKVEPMPFNNASAATQAWLTGAADISIIGGVSTLALRNEGVDAKILMTAMMPTSNIIAGKDVDIEKGDYAGLKGLTLGTLGAQGAAIFRSLYDQAGLDRQDMKLVISESQGSVISAMQQNQIQITGFGPIETLKLINQIGGKVVFDCSMEPLPDYCKVPLTVATAKGDWLAANPKQAEAFVRGMGKLFELSRTDPDKVLTAAMARQTPPVTDLEAFREGGQPTIDAWKLALPATDFDELNKFGVEIAEQLKAPVDYSEAVWSEAPAIWAEYPNASPKPSP
ncbi:ABC transporter substrate-binding protein [Rhodococcus koreensis]